MNHTNDPHSPVSGNDHLSKATAIPNDAAHWQRQATRNGLIGLILAVGASLTVALSYANFSMRLHVIAAMGIGLLQACCVAAVSMHLKEEKDTITRPLLITLVLVSALLGLSLLGFSDRAHF